MWQEGPEFLRLPEEEWPTKKKPRSDLKLPELKQKFVGIATTNPPKETLPDRFNLARFSKWRLLIHTTARIMKLYDKYKVGSISQMEPEAKDLEKAEELWVQEAQKQLNLDAIQKLQPVNEKGIVVAGGRTERWMQATWNRQKFVVLPKEHPISILIAVYEHEKGGHLGVEASIAKVRSKFWIIGIRRTMKRIVSKCCKCRKRMMVTCEQTMSPLPTERIQPSPPFANVCIDYFGPFQIKGEAQKRVRSKCYGVIFTCMVVRAVHLDLATNYSTDSFLQVLRRFGSIRGWPQRIYSDGGTQLVGASRELREQIKGLEWDKIKAFGHEQGIVWKFSPGDGPWYNGTAEALIKTTKKALNASIGEAILSFSELQTYLMEVGQLVNQRPIGVFPNSPQDGTYLCPNDLLLGRASAKIPQGPFKERTSYKCRLDFLESIVTSFWRRWTREAFPNLVIRPKWHTERRALISGDIVLIQDSNEIRGRWKMGLVTEPLPSEDGKVRRVKLVYRTEAGAKQEVERPVQRLILLVAADDSTVAGECSAIMNSHSSAE